LLTLITTSDGFIKEESLSGHDLAAEGFLKYKTKAKYVRILVIENT